MVRGLLSSFPSRVPGLVLHSRDMSTASPGTPDVSSLSFSPSTARNSLEHGNLHGTVGDSLQRTSSDADALAVGSLSSSSALVSSRTSSALSYWKDAVMWKSPVTSITLYLAGIFIIGLARAFAALPFIPVFSNALTLLIFLNAIGMMLKKENFISAESCVRVLSYGLTRAARVYDDVARANDPATMAIIVALLWLCALVGRLFSTYFLLAMAWSALFTVPVTFDAVLFGDGAEAGAMLPAILAQVRSAAFAPVKLLDKVRIAVYGVPIQLRAVGACAIMVAASYLPWMILIRLGLLIHTVYHAAMKSSPSVGVGADGGAHAHAS